MKRGFVLGKFLPPHAGHVYMFELAKQYCDELTIYIVTRSDEPIPGHLRYKWIKEMFPDCRVIWREDDVIPQQPHEHPDFQQIWVEDVITTMGDSGYDYVFASESYGKWIADGIGAEFVPVDMSRIGIPTSGTSVRLDPKSCWKYIPEVVRPYYTKRICLFGPESTGKSTLAKQLADHYQTLVVPEYGRIYTETFGPEITPADMEKIYRGQIASTRTLMGKGNYVVICDTDPVLSAVWSDALTGQRADFFNTYRDYCDLYLLMDTDLPWEDDGTRYFKDPEDREHFFNQCKKELYNRGLKYKVVRGIGTDRFDVAVTAIDQYLTTI